MKLLLDTHFVLWALDDLAHGLSESDPYAEAMAKSDLFASVVSMWESDIKWRLGKLPLKRGVQQWPGMLESNAIELLALEAQHVVADIGNEPGNKDPFDRLLLCVAASEGCLLLTRDRILLQHPLAWKTFPA